MDGPVKLYRLLLPLALLFSLSGCALYNELKDPATDDDGDGWSELYGDCDDGDPSINPDASEGGSCDGFDNDCSGAADEGLTHTFYPDADRDGWGDANADGSVGCFAESMVSSFVENNGDCDDSTTEINPDAIEICDADGIDENCDGETLDPTTWYPDVDGDGYGDWDEEAEAVESCEDPGDGFVGNDEDCNDGSEYIRPGVAEICDTIDNNCNGTINEPSEATPTWGGDADEDNYGDPTVQTVNCQFPDGSWVVGSVLTDGSMWESSPDCDDTDPLVNPGAEEVCDNGVDDDCDGTADICL